MVDASAVAPETKDHVASIARRGLRPEMDVARLTRNAGKNMNVSAAEKNRNAIARPTIRVTSRGIGVLKKIVESEDAPIRHGAQSKIDARWNVTMHYH